MAAAGASLVLLGFATHMAAFTCGAILGGILLVALVPERVEL